MKIFRHISVKLIIILVILEMAGAALVLILNNLGFSLDKGFFGYVHMMIFFIVNCFVVSRIKGITKTVNEIAKGNYTVRVKEKGNDELTELSRSINIMSAELEANLNLSRDFTRYVSHEFKTPIAVIRNYAEAAQLCGDTLKTGEYLETIISEADKLSRISKTVLDICRIDSTNAIAKDDSVCPASQIRKILVDFQFEWGQKDIEVIPELDDFEIISNSELLFHIWQNLITNAVKYTNEHGKIDIFLKSENEEIIFIISDNGIGIPEEDMEHIFTPFFTGKKSDSSRDSGLGLALVKTAAEKLGGNIICESEYGKGTKFTVKIPI